MLGSNEDGRSRIRHELDECKILLCKPLETRVSMGLHQSDCRPDIDGRMWFVWSELDETLK